MKVVIVTRTCSCLQGSKQLDEMSLKSGPGREGLCWDILASEIWDDTPVHAYTWGSHIELGLPTLSSSAVVSIENIEVLQHRMVVSISPVAQSKFGLVCSEHRPQNYILLITPPKSKATERWPQLGRDNQERQTALEEG